MTAPAFTIVDVIPDTPEWREERRKSIGASDAANVLFVPGAFGTPLEVYRSKLGHDEPFSQGEERAWWGHELETSLAKRVAQTRPELGEVTDGFMARSVAYPFVHASFDRFVGGVPLQLKTVHEFASSDWEDGPPRYVWVQEQTEMLVAGSDRAYVAALFGGVSSDVFTITRDDAFIEGELLPKLSDMWDRVLRRDPPEVLTLGDAKRRWVDDGTVVNVEAPDLATRLLDLWELWMTWEGEISELTAMREGAKLELQKAMGDAQELRVNGRLLFKWKADVNGVRRFTRVKGD